MVLVPLHPWPPRAASRAVVRRGGAVAFLGLARAGRSTAGPALLPAPLLALTTASFGTEVLGGVADARAAASLRLVGADAVVDGGGAALPPALVARVSHSPGVRAVTGIQEDWTEAYAPAGVVFELDAVDPAPYAALSRAAGAGGFAPSLLHYGGSGPIPVLASRAMAAYLGSGPQTIDTQAFGPVTVHVVGRLDRDLSNPVGEFVILPRAALPVPVGARQPLGPASLLLSGPVQAKALRAAVKATRGRAAVSLRLRSEVAGQTRSRTPLENGAERLYGWTVAAAALLALTALLLALLQAVPERASLLARLRTMGMTPRQGYRLIMVESLPQVLLGVLAGAALGLVAIPLLGPSVDLSALAAADGPSAALHVRWLALLVPALVLLLLTAAVVAAEAAVIGRRQIAVELRAGGAR